MPVIKKKKAHRMRRMLLWAGGWGKKKRRCVLQYLPKNKPLSRKDGSIPASCLTNSAAVF